MLGANDEYIALCRRHFLEGKLRGYDDVIGFTD
jgi:thymidine kinase